MTRGTKPIKEEYLAVLAKYHNADHCLNSIEQTERFAKDLGLSDEVIGTLYTIKSMAAVEFRNAARRMNQIAAHHPEVSQMTQEVENTEQPVSLDAVQFWFVWTKRGYIPKVAHDSFDKAVDEATRLARKHPDRKFIVLDAKCKIGVVAEPAGEPMIQLEESDGFGKPFVPVGEPFPAPRAQS